MSARVVAILRAVAWSLVAVLVAFGGAGIVAGLDHPAGEARPELTWAGDRAVEAGLDAATDDLEAIARDLARLTDLGRTALAAFAAADAERLEAALAAGARLVPTIEDRTAKVRRELLILPGMGRGAELRIGEPQRDRHAALVAALESTGNVDGPWFRLSQSTLVGSRLATLLARHDEIAFAATAAGRRARYAEAIERLDEAEATLDQAVELRNELRGVVDVTTLDEWLRRNRAYDVALRDLYTAFRKSRGRVTAAVREAVAAELEARERLPPDSRGIVVIMADISRAGANQAVVEIERIRGRLDGALAVVREGEATSAP